MEPDPLLSDPRHLALLADNAVLRSEVVRLREVLEALKATLERTEKLLESLQERLGKDSHNSNHPPSSDGPGAAPTPPAAPRAQAWRAAGTEGRVAAGAAGGQRGPGGAGATHMLPTLPV